MALPEVVSSAEWLRARLALLALVDRSDGSSCSVSRCCRIGWCERAAHWSFGMSHTHLPVTTPLAQNSVYPPRVVDRRRLLAIGLWFDRDCGGSPRQW